MSDDEQIEVTAAAEEENFDMADEEFVSNGPEALKQVGSEKGAWNWCLIGADPKELPLAGGGAGFVDEMRDCLITHGHAVLFGLIRCAFTRHCKSAADGLTFKWVFVSATLDGGTMTAVQRGRAVSKRPVMEKAIKGFAHTVLSLDLTDAEDLTTDFVVSKLNAISKGASDGVLQIPAYESAPVIMPAFQVEDKKSGYVVGEITERKAPEPKKAEDAPQAPAAEEPAPAAEEPAPAAEEAAPKEEAPADTPAPAEEPEKPAEEAPKEEEPKVLEEPKAEEPKVLEEPKAEEPKLLAELKVEAPKILEELKKEEPTAEEPHGETAGTGPADKNGYKKGDLVDIYSLTEKKWFTDGVIEEIRLVTSATPDGKPLPAGCAKVVYSNGQRGKWLQPEAMADRNLVKPSIKPQVFAGFLKKETHNILSEWHVRHMELRDGFFTWWISEEDAKCKVKPQCALELVGLQMKATATSTRFALRTASSKGVVYNFDCATGTPAAKSVEDWAAALKQHAAYANRMHKFRQQTAAAAKAKK